MNFLLGLPYYFQHKLIPKMSGKFSNEPGEFEPGGKWMYRPNFPVFIKQLERYFLHNEKFPLY